MEKKKACVGEEKKNKKKKKNRLRVFFDRFRKRVQHACEPATGNRDRTPAPVVVLFDFLVTASPRLPQAQLRRNLGDAVGLGGGSRCRADAASLRLWAELFF